MTEFKEGDYFIALWFIPGRERDWQAILYRRGDDPAVRMVSRFRYYADEKVFESEDRKSWYSGAFIGKSDQEAIASVDYVTAKMVGPVAALIDDVFFNAKIDKVVVQGDFQKLMDLTKDKPWAHWKFEPIQ